jgi:hypothetical protein
MRGAIPPLPQYDFMALCSVKQCYIRSEPQYFHYNKDKPFPFRETNNHSPAHFSRKLPHADSILRDIRR